MRSTRIAVAALALSAVTVAGCASESDSRSSGPSDAGPCADASGDLLAKICDRGTIVVSTDPAYPPQSSYDPKTDTYKGFDIDVATEIADRLGVKVSWETPAWEVITAGSWNGRFDMTVGSMTPTNDRQKVLAFSEPYYYTPAVVVVHADNTSATDIATDLDGATIGVCSACTYEQYLNKSLAIKGFTFDFVIDDATIKGYDTDTTALQDLALGDGTRLDAVITSLTTAQGFIDSGKPVKIVGDPVFFEPLAVGTDKSAPDDSTALAAAIDDIVKEMHADGTLTQLSEKWYDGTDLSVQK